MYVKYALTVNEMIITSQACRAGCLYSRDGRSFPRRRILEVGDVCEIAFDCQRNTNHICLMQRRDQAVIFGVLWLFFLASKNTSSVR